jgi:hypothetical protein
MIRLERARSKEAIPGGLRGRYLRDKNLTLLRLRQAKGKLLESDFNSNWWKPAKDRLKAETRGKCAYCEASTAVVAHGDVEHFRPKSRYWWLAYCLDNYLYSCQICNQIYKGDRFPISGAPLAGPEIPVDADAAVLNALASGLTHDPLTGQSDGTLAAFCQAAAAEQAHLIDPYASDPEPLLVWTADPDLREVRVAVAPHIPNAAEATQSIESCCGLNREELRRLRWKVYEVLVRVKAILESTEDPAILAPAREIIALRMASDAEYAGMARYFSRLWGLV